MLRSVFGRILWDHRVGVWGWMLGLTGLTLLTVSFYPTIREEAGFAELLEALPPQLLAAFGVDDPTEMTTSIGLVNSRIYGSLGAILLVVLAVSIGTQAIAGEEERGTMDLVLAQPVRRMRVVVDAFAAMAALIGLLALSLLVVVAATNPVFDLELPAEGIVAANVGVALLALVYGGVALAVGGLTGRRRVTLAVTTALVVAGFFVNGLGAVVDALRPFRTFSPFHWYLAPDPLADGFDWASLALMAGVTVGLVGLAAWAFDRRDVAS